MKSTEISPIVLAPLPPNTHGLLHDRYPWEGFEVLNNNFLRLSSFPHIFRIVLHGDPFSTRKERYDFRFGRA